MYTPKLIKPEPNPGISAVLRVLERVDFKETVFARGLI
jgi:hypothetical protein